MSTDLDLREILTDAFESIEGEAPTTYTDELGYVYNIVDGEIVGKAGIDDCFQIDTEASADWALERLSDADADLAGHAAKTLALLDRLESEQRRLLARRQWLAGRFGPQLEAFARQRLEGTDRRTLRLTWGEVSFRRTRGTNRIVDDASAVAWVKAHRPDLVRVKVEESVTATDVLAVRDALVAEFGDAAPVGRMNFLESTGPGEKVEIRTGIATETSTKGRRR